MHERAPHVPRLTDDLVAALLTTQGFAVPGADLHEIAETARFTLDQALDWEARDPFDHEPWSH